MPIQQQPRGKEGCHADTEPNTGPPMAQSSTLLVRKHAPPAAERVSLRVSQQGHPERQQLPSIASVASENQC